MTDPNLTDKQRALDTVRTGAALVDLPTGGWIIVRGSDRVRWLNGMVTNSVQALQPGEGAYSFLLSAQGRIQGDCTVWAEPDRLLLQTDSTQAANVIALLDRFIIMDDVELEDVSAMSHGLAVIGPRAQPLLQQACTRNLPDEPTRRVTAQLAGENIILIHAHSPLVPRFELWSPDAPSLARVREALIAAGAEPCPPEPLELLRILEGTPRFGTDIRDKDLPQETAQTRALHFNKGCYLGQEIVERIRSRGNVHRTFTAFTLTGPSPAAGTPLLADGKQIGELTSIAAELIDGQRLALGTVRREALERGVALTYTVDDATGHASERKLPPQA